MQNKAFRFGPLALTNAAANILNPGTTNAGVNDGTASKRIILTHVRVVNKTAAIHSVSLFLGATGGSAAGTEVMFSASQVPANGTSSPNWLDWYGRLPLDAADFLTGLADVITALTIEGEGEIGIA